MSHAYYYYYSLYIYKTKETERGDARKKTFSSVSKALIFW
jgi:hypothetical protein